MQIVIKVPFKTPTINHLYGQRGFRKFLKPEAKKLRSQIKEILSDKINTLNLLNGLSVIVEIHENWLCKDGSIKRKDISNREKFLIDSVFNELKIDDKYIFEHTMRKIQDTKEFAIIKINEIK